MAGSVVNPSTPYIGPVQGGVQDGMSIIVSGNLEHHHNGFLISLQAGGSIDPRSDCAFVFNPRFADNQVIRNSLQSGSWGAEERHGGFPFQKGQNCEVTIHVKHNCFKVSVNGRHFCDYNHRMPKHRVTHISVEQGIRISHVRFEHGHGQQGGAHDHHHHHSAIGDMGAAIGKFAGEMFSGGVHVTSHHSGHPPNYPQPGPPAGAYPGGGASSPIYNPPVPFTQSIPGGMYPNKMIFISGIPNPNPSRFSIYIQKGQQYEPNDISMVFDSRFRYNVDSNVVVCNSRQHGNWGSEERGAAYYPFMPNTNFDIIILVEQHRFKIAVNNQHLLEFNHRLQPLGRADTIRIDGDVRLTQVRFQ